MLAVFTDVFAGDVPLLQLPNFYTIFTHRSAAAAIAMSSFLPHRVTILCFVFQVNLQRKRRTSAEL